MLKEKFTDLRIHTIKINDTDQVAKLQFVDAQFLIFSETGLTSFNRFIKNMASMKQMIVFSKLHIMGDKLLKPTSDIEIASEGVQAISSLFYEGFF